MSRTRVKYILKREPEEENPSCVLGEHSDTAEIGYFAATMSGSQVYESQQRELAQLRAQNQELMRINNEWDKEYREQREAFRRYQSEAETENCAAIARLKEKVTSVEEERDKLEDQLTRPQRELHSLRERLAVAESLRGTGGGGGVARLEEELSLMRQQVKAYEEDFEAEKREKERLKDEKQSAAVRCEAERTTLQLRLDRCQADLAHFTAEANRLAHQLRLKNQIVEEGYRERLENKGFVSRTPSRLPPQDPAQ